MFEKSPTWQRYSNPVPRVVRVHLGHVPELDDDRTAEKKGLRIALAAALLFHVGLLLVHLPDLMGETTWQAGQQQVFVVQPVRFEPPPAPAQQLQRPKEKRRTIPVPDPTPDDPEPIRAEEVEVPEFETADLTFGLGIPDAPPLVAYGGGGPLHVGGDVTPPVKIYSPSPPYTEEARQSRVQGVVILEAIIDALGNVSDVRVLKGLPDGLSESAVAAARSWRFRPATRDGAPVPVFFNLTIRFSLQ